MNEITQTPASVWNTLQRNTRTTIVRKVPIGTTTVDNTSVNELKDLIAKFDLARSKGVQTPKIRLDTFLFKAAPLTGTNPGAIYVTEDKLYLGKIVGDRFSPSPDCRPSVMERVFAATKNISAAAEAYGVRTGNCCVCGRTLTNGESIAARIGPICAGNFGF